MLQNNMRGFGSLSNAIRLNLNFKFATDLTKPVCTRNMHYAASCARLRCNDAIHFTKKRSIPAFFQPYNFNYTILVRSESTSIHSAESLGSLQPTAIDSNLKIANTETATVVNTEPVPIVNFTENVSSSASQNNEAVINSSEILNSASVEQTGVDAAVIPESSIGGIPEPPIAPESIEEFFSAAAPVLNGEQSFASLGLGGWSPSGIAQQCLEFLHVGFGLPWWVAILTGTVIVRVLLFPLVVKSQRNAAKMSNHMPQIQLLQMKMTEARQSGNALMAAKYGNDMMLFMKEKEISPFKSMLVPLAMAPVFMSFFFGLRSMANLPVDSLKTGGIFWFTDLTLADPFYLLPLITSVTMWITLEIGVDGARLSTSPHGGLMKYFLRAMPVIMFPFTMNFPAAILCYWVSTNAVSLIQVSFLKIPAVKQKLNIEAIRPISKEDLPIPKKGFVKSFRDSWTNMKISKEMEDRELYDDISFKRAGRGPIPKTYKYDPTKVNENVIQAKQK